MEKLKVKHDHTLTDILKVLIFTLMLLLPGICFIPNALYYGFNEHATNTETTTINYKYQSNEVNDIDDIVIDNLYTFESFGWTYSDYQIVDEFTINIYYFSDFRIDANNQDVDEVFISSFTQNRASIRFTDERMYFFFTNNDTYVAYYYEEYDFGFDNLVFSVDEYSIEAFKSFIDDNYDLPTYTDYNVIESVEINTNDTISNKMYQAWQNLWQTPLLNWTNTTPFNTGLNNFVGVFGITQDSYLANCLIYILSITAIYVVFDIILSMFKWLTHLIGAK